MRKVVYFIATLFIVSVLTAVTTVPAVADTNTAAEIPVVAAWGSENTAPQTPLWYLYDNNTGTVWATQSTTPAPASAWFEVKLEAPAVIDYIEIAGFQGGSQTAAIEFQDSSGAWQPFLNHQQTALANGRIDLSWNYTATQYLRFKISNSGSCLRLGDIGELKVFGHSMEELTLLPFQINASTEDLSYPAGFLNDHNTYTSWRAETNATQATVTFDLTGESNIRLLKYYNKNGLGILNLKVLSGANWLTVGMPIDLSAVPVGWQEAPVNMTASAVRFELTLTGSCNYIGGIAEVELWGEAVSAKKTITLGQNITSLATLDFTIDNPDNYTSFELWATVPEGVTDGNFNLSINGQNVSVAYKVISGPGYTLIKIPLNPANLRTGQNIISVDLGTMVFNEVSLLMSPYDGVLEISKVQGLTELRSLSDGFLYSGSSEYTTTIDLDLTSTATVDALRFYGSVTPGIINLSIWQSGAWVPVEQNKLNLQGSLLTITGGTPATAKIRIQTNDAYFISNLTEIKAYGSKVNQDPPKVTISEPAQYDLLQPNSQVTIKGMVDNPDVGLTINGVSVSLSGHYFSYVYTVQGGSGNQTIDIVATDSQNRTGSAQLIFNVYSPPDLTCNLAATTYTGSNELTVSGTANGAQTVKVNGAAVSVSGGNYSYVLSLTEGENLVVIEAFNNSGAVCRLERRIIMDTKTPVLTVDQPFDGMTVTSGIITISGTYHDISPVSITVNGNPITSGNNTFSGTVTLVSGNNQLTIIGQDTVGHQRQIILNVVYVITDITVTTPTNGAFVKNPVTVSGQITGMNPASLCVNGQYLLTAEDGSFTTELTLVDGPQTVTLSAVTFDGKSINKEINLTGDNTGPLPFTVTSTAEDWTNNNLPVFSFATSDVVSGLDHYEIRLNNGSWITPVSSPYQFPEALADGENTVEVKAVDEVGNTTTATVSAKIDTVAPLPPDGFETIPGIGKNILKWQYQQTSDIASYTIQRTPSFSGSIYRQVIISPENNINDQYVDEEVIPESTYSYTIKAIDRAGNTGGDTAGTAVKVGVTEQTVDTTGGSVKFDYCQVNLPDSALTEPGQVIIQEDTQELPANDFAASVSPTYNFTLKNQQGEIIEETFNQPVTLEFSYAALTVPEGFTPGDLGIYWFNPEIGGWQKLEGVTIDYINQVLSVQSVHFSSYQVMASSYMSPSLDSYYNMGIAPYQSYFLNNQENVSTTNGSLSIIATDVNIPGPEGFDLVVKRSYDSWAAHNEKINGNNAPYTAFSNGWSLNIPWIENSNSGKIIHLPDGQAVPMTFKNNKFEFHEGNHFTVVITEKNFWGTPIAYALTLKDGTKYLFEKTDSYILPTYKYDPTGRYYQHYTFSSKHITSIQDSIGRTLQFTYKTETGLTDLLDNIKLQNTNKVLVTYQYDTSKRLNKVLDAKSRPTTYGYDQEKSFETGTSLNRTVTNSSGSSSTTNENKIKTYSVTMLNSITYPSGGVSSYIYDYLNQPYTQSWSYQKDTGNVKYTNVRIMVKSHSLLGKTESYEYIMNEQIGSYIVITGHYDDNGNFLSGTNGQFILPNTYIFTTTKKENDDNKQIVEDYQQLVTDSYDSYLFVNIPSKYQNYKGGLLTSTDIIYNGNNYETITYGYFWPTRAVTSEQHYRNNQLVSEISSSYNGDGNSTWGNVTFRFDHSIDGKRRVEETWSYQTHPTIHGLVNTYIQGNYNPVSNTLSTVTTTYGYDSYWTSKPASQTVTFSSNGTQKTYTTTYTYYPNSSLSKGILETRTDPSGLKTTFEYDDTKGVFPKKQTVTEVKDADGQAIAQIDTEFGYDVVTGLKMWERNFRGATSYDTNYVYDELNRIVQVELPDDDTTIHPKRKYDFYDDDNYCNFFNENGQKTKFSFDGLGRLTEIIKYHNAAEYKTKYDYDTEGRIWKVTDAKNNITTYDYDPANRVTKVTYPDTKYVQLVYDDLTNKVTIIDEYGNTVATEWYDWSHRLVSAEQYSIFGGDNATYSWEFNYDSLGHQIYQEDPLHNQTIQEYDPLGRLLQVTLPGANLDAPGTFVKTAVINPVYHEPQIKFNAYDTFGNCTSKTDANGNTTTYEYDELGRLKKETVTATKYDFSNPANNTVDTMTTIYYYDEAGNKVRMVDPNGKEWGYDYSVRGYLLSEYLITRENNNIIRNYETQYRYDPMGNKIAVIDPRNTHAESDRNKSWYSFTPEGVLTLTDPRTEDRTKTTWYVYDDLNRLSRIILPDDAPPANPYSNPGDNPVSEITYDAVGNKETVKDPNGAFTIYNYDNRNRVTYIKVSDVAVTDVYTGGIKKQHFEYTYEDYKYETKVYDYIDALDNYALTVKMSDSLGRLRRVAYPKPGEVEEYEYDAVGNRTEATDGRGNATTYNYNALGLLTQVTDPLSNATRYYYDYNGNQVGVHEGISDGRNLVTINVYDELNRVVQNIDSLEVATKYQYNLNGNRDAMLDRQETTWKYLYDDRNLLTNVKLYAQGTVSEPPDIELQYTYDNAGNRTGASESKTGTEVTALDYTLDARNQITNIARLIDAVSAVSYSTDYQYDKAGLLTGIKYPLALSNTWVSYKYNSFNQLNKVVAEIPGTPPQEKNQFIQSPVNYNRDGTINSFTLGNGLTTTYQYDENRRLNDIATGTNGNVLKLHYDYDASGNITNIREGTVDNVYTYDARNQLQTAQIPGITLESDPTPGQVLMHKKDYSGLNPLSSTEETTVKLDIDSTSIGISMGSAPAVKVIKLIPDKSITSHRVTEKSLDVYKSSDNAIYEPVSGWSFSKDAKGVITITLASTVNAPYIKIHFRFDDRTADYEPDLTKAQFMNDIAKVVEIYQEGSERLETYQYDASGNRSSLQVTVVRPITRGYSYYPDCNRLMSDGKYAYTYDNAGNLTEKGNKYSINGNSVTFNQTSGDGVEYWHYTYDLLNRLIKVEKNGKIVSEYEYDPEGLRVVKKTYDETETLKDTTHYVFSGTEPIFERKLDSNNNVIGIHSYIYALGTHIARVDGVIGDTQANVYYYHTDNLGSIKAVTDQSGNVVFNAKYGAFGTQYGTNGELDEDLGFTGKEYDSDIGLYYYNARWYDPELGRFISEDPGADPNNQNLYTYCASNPVNRTDPTGNYFTEDGTELVGPPEPPSSNSPGGSSSGSPPSLPDRVIAAEKNFPGFKFDWDSASKPGEVGLTLENQIQIYLHIESRKAELINKHGSLTDKDKVMLYKETSALRAACMYLNVVKPGANLIADLFKKGQDKLGAYYTGEQIESALTDLSFMAFAITMGVAEGIPALKTSLKFNAQLRNAITESLEGNMMVKPGQLWGRQLKEEFSGNLIKRIKSSMLENGYNGKAIEVFEVDGRLIILDGHHRARAAGAVGLEKIPIRVVSQTELKDKWGLTSSQLVDQVIAAASQQGRSWW